MRVTYEGIFTRQPQGAYAVDFPDFAGCSTFGDDLSEAIDNAASVLESFVSIALAEGVQLPEPQARQGGTPADDSFGMLVSVDVDPDEDIPVRTTSEAAEMLGVSTGRVRQMIGAGILERRKVGRDNLVTLESIERRLERPRHAGRPKKGEGDG